MCGYPGLFNRNGIFINVANTLEQEDLTPHGDSQLLGHLFRTRHNALVDPQRIRFFTAQHHLLRKTARFFKRILEDIINLRSITAGTCYYTFFFQGLHRLAYRNPRNAGQLAEVALAGQDIAVLQDPTAHSILHRLRKFHIQRRVIRR